MHVIYNNETCEAVLLVDLSNMFNSVNRNVLLRNVSIMCPAIATYVKNCYSVHETISSKGTTQGDSVAMSIHAIVIIIIIIIIIITLFNVGFTKYTT